MRFGTDHCTLSREAVLIHVKGDLSAAVMLKVHLLGMKIKVGILS